ncbi:hypothetical protein C2S53_017896 [Perilla frutescens var. hirtella]|uniref:Uncharacterized protein n=1 Tax=Perilla frutescens var. hirtella TaxID=608512 RepID=A0AAD4ILP9_PERFH|nr:hypothetical protein C2S53_017896 [Perilla frutescens var. hirtella]
MRIRGRNPAADCSVSSSPSSSLSSSITAADSLSSSQDSSTSCRISPSPTASPRCRGLDLLVKAIHQVNGGSIVGVPYIQRRVTIRRRRRSCMIEFDAFVLDELRQSKRGGIAKKAKKGKNPVGVSSRVKDSVMQPSRRRSNRFVEMGS